ncbi:MAG: DNA mismatch repair protein MutS, partial [Alphaproteobacteria bacterium]
MSRRLSAHEQALWSRVAATVRPIASKRAAMVAPPPP